MKRLLMLALSMFVFIMAIMMNFLQQILTVFADGEPVSARYSIIATTPEYYNNAQTLYGISDTEKELYTPFNQVDKVYMDGWSFKPAKNSYGEINSTYTSIDNEVIDVTGKSLFLWIYFAPGIFHEKLKITLGSSSGNIEFVVTSYELNAILMKEDVDWEDGYSWNLLEFPISKTGSYDITSITFNTFSTTQEEGLNISEMNIYSVYIDNSEANYINAKVKQKFLDWEVIYPSQTQIEKLYLGSSIKPAITMSQNVSYAFYGKYNLLTENTASWRVGVRYNGGEAKYYNLGESITFDKEGAYIVYYECSFAGKKHVAQPTVINIEKFIAIYFENPSYTKLEVGKSYLINFIVNDGLTKTTDITLNFNSAYINAEVVEDGVIKVTVKKKGNTTLRANVSGIYVGSLDPVDFEAKTTLQLVGQAEDNFHVFKLYSFIFLGCVVVAIIVFLVISFVKSRKIDVK